MSLLPQIKAATQESVTKLTHRQLRVADILNRGGGQLNTDPSLGLISPYRNSAGAGRLVHDNSMVTIGSMMGGSDANVASHKLFLTGGKEDKSRDGSRNQ
jgi:hypothetical protein